MSDNGVSHGRSQTGVYSHGVQPESHWRRRALERCGYTPAAIEAKLREVDNPPDPEQDNTTLSRAEKREIKKMVDHLYNSPAQQRLAAIQDELRCLASRPSSHYREPAATQWAKALTVWGIFFLVAWAVWKVVWR